MPEGRSAAVAVLALGAYIALVSWFDIFPWNDLRNAPRDGVLVAAVCGATLLLALWLIVGGRLAGGAVSLLLIVWGALQVKIWWLPYFREPNEAWREFYEDWFSQTVTLLPRAGHALPPDANHTVMHLLLLVAIAFSLNAYFPRPKGAS